MPTLNRPTGSQQRTFSVLGVPFFLNGAQFDRDVLLSPLQYVLTLLIFGGTLSILYLYLFNRRGRRSLHDLAVGSTVVTTQTPLAAVRPMPVWRVHLVVVAVLMIAAAAVPAFTGQLAQNDYFKDLLAAHEAVSAEPGVQSARVVHNTVFGTPNVESVVVQVNLSERRIDDNLARVVLANDKKAAAMSAIHVTLVYGYDLASHRPGARWGISSRRKRWRRPVTAMPQREAEGSAFCLAEGDVCDAACEGYRGDLSGRAPPVVAQHAGNASP